MVAALGRPVAVPDLRQPDESIYRCASCQNYRRSFHFLTFPVTGIRRVAHYAVGGEGRPQSLSSFWDGFTGKDNTGTDNEPGNQLAGFDFKFKLEPTLGWPVSFYGQMIGEDESGYLPSANMFLGGVEGHHGWGKDAVNWYRST